MSELKRAGLNLEAIRVAIFEILKNADEAGKLYPIGPAITKELDGLLIAERYARRQLLAELEINALECARPR
jgi:hypothetical protein